MRPEKRTKIRIYSDILEALFEKMSDDVVCPTRISQKTNMPYDRFSNYLDELVRVGMVSRRGNNLDVTEKGLEYIEWHRKMVDFLKRMGLPS